MSNHSSAFEAAFAQCPAVAILRGVTPTECVEVAEALVSSGFRIVEVPLNSPDPLTSVRKLRAHFGDRVVVGAGTVLTEQDVDAVAQAGGQICVAPNCDPRVIRRAIAQGVVPLPGVATASEAFSAVEEGATFLKLFPADALGTSTVKSLLSVLPKHVRLIAVGGLTSRNAAEFIAAGCAGVGTGSDVYKPGLAAAEAGERAKRLLRALGTRVRQLSTAQVRVGESPFWNERTREIVWVDFAAPAIVRCAVDGAGVREPTSAPLDTTLSVVMPAPDGRVLGVAADSIREVDIESGKTRHWATVALPFANTRLNDATMDPLGRIWSGSMSYALISGHGALFVTDTKGATRQLAGGFGVCNGIGFSSDHRKLFLVDTLHRTLLSFDCDIESAQVSPPRIVTDFLHVPGKPDGLAVAEDGAVWVAMWGGSRVVRVERDGSISRQIVIPAKHASNGCFIPGKPDTLYVTTSRFRLSEAELAEAPWSGSLIAVDLPA
ncbi:MAG: 2-dehydro-3-deoxy-6-phosphogalactonate aldolase [Pseudomonadota bacterium]